MRPVFAAFLLSTASLVAAQANIEEFWWSYPPENYTETHPFGYDPEFSTCGGSCEACNEGAVKCFASEAKNICYEPRLGEKCCKDKYGSACTQGYFCAYNDENAAFCCKEGTNAEDCGNLFDPTQILSSTQSSEAAAATTLVVTQVRTEMATASATSHPLKYTSPPQLGNLAQSNNNDGGMSVGAKVGIAVGAVAFAGLVAAAVVFLVLRRRRASKYGAVVPPTAGQHIPPGVDTSYAPPAYTDPRASAFEPMRGADQSEYYKPAPGQSPQPSAAVPYQDAPVATYRQEAAIAEMPGRDTEVHEMGTSAASPK